MASTSNQNQDFNNSYFKAITDSMHSAIVCFDMDKKVVYSNPSFSKITGYEIDEERGGFWNFISPDFYKEIYSYWLQAFENKTFNYCEFKLIKKDGEEKWVSFHCHPVLGENQEQVATYVRLIDIDFHKRAGLAYSKNREMVMSGFLKAPFPTAIIASDGELIQINESWVSYSGYSLKELNKLETLVKIFRLENLAQLKKLIKIWFNSKKEDLKGEIKIQNKQGQIRIWEYGTTYLSSLADGRQISLGMVYDVTEERLALESLQESESRFRLMADSAPMMIWQTEKINGATFFNKTWIDFIGKPVEELLNYGWVNFVHPDDRVKVVESFINNTFLQTSKQVLEFRLKKHNGQYRWIYNRGTPRFTEKGDFIGFISSSLDITERKIAEEKIKESEANLQAIFNSSIQSYILLDKEYRVQAFNNKANSYSQALFKKDMYKNTLIFDYIFAQDKDLLIELFQTALLGQFTTFEYEMVFSPTHAIWLEMNYLPVYEDENIIGVCLSTLDITDRKKSEQEIKNSAHFIEKIADSSPNMLYLLDVQKDRFIYINRAWESILGFDLEYIKTVSAQEFFAKQIKPQYLEKYLSNSNFSEENVQITTELQFLDQNDNWRWIQTSEIVFSKNADGSVKQILGTSQDITSRKEMEEKLIHDAFYDTLTHLPNRRFFLDELKKCLDYKNENPNYFFAVLFMDLDRFKFVNDSLGHSIGDQLLIAVSKRLKYAIKPTDLVARLGGDEFIILIKDLKTVREVVKIAESIHKQISQPFLLQKFNISTTSSIGIAPANKNYTDAENILRDADTAMYRAKFKGRNTYAIFNQEMHTLALQTLETEAQLAKAIKKNELELFYQPVWSIKDQKITSCEALIRWNHPTRGLLEPKNFLVIAEETGLIIEIDKWVLDMACKQLSIWSKAGLTDFKIAVNLSLKQLKQEKLLFWTKRILTKYNINPKQIKFELTENSLIDNSQQTIDTLNKLRHMGIQLCIDDFGTGYSSLMYLKNLPVDVLKIDRSFIIDLAESSQAQAISKAIIDLAHNLKLKVTAEGVETIEQLNFLESIGCDQIQGYYISCPVDAETFFKMVCGEIDQENLETISEING